jgi:hypothetical protein
MVFVLLLFMMAVLALVLSLCWLVLLLVPVLLLSLLPWLLRLLWLLLLEQSLLLLPLLEQLLGLMLPLREVERFCSSPDDMEAFMLLRLLRLLGLLLPLLEAEDRSCSSPDDMDGALDAFMPSPQSFAAASAMGVSAPGLVSALNQLFCLSSGTTVSYYLYTSTCSFVCSASFYPQTATFRCIFNKK